MNELETDAQKVLQMEAEAILDLIPRVDEHFDAAVDMILACEGRVIMTGMGKSGIIAHKISATLASTGTPSFYLHPAEGIHGDLGMVTADDVNTPITNTPNTNHTGILLAKLKDRYGAGVEVVPQKVAYRETIKGNSDVQGKHKKQSGGAGQYGDVHIRFSPSQEPGLEFSEELFGGSVPKNYVPAVEKGLLECMEKGPLAGCKVQNIKAVLYDGSYHEVDSNEVSFKIAASLAFKKGIVEAKPCLLEPIMKLEINVPADYVGAVMGDLPTRRGSVMGMDPLPGGRQMLHAEAPQAELFDYAIVLRSMTQARGSFTMEFARYQEVPAMNAQKIIDAHKAEEENA